MIGNFGDMTFYADVGLKKKYGTIHKRQWPFFDFHAQLHHVDIFFYLYPSKISRNYDPSHFQIVDILYGRPTLCSLNRNSYKKFEQQKIWTTKEIQISMEITKELLNIAMYAGAPYVVRPARQKAAEAALRHYRSLTWHGRARRAVGAPGLCI